MMIRPTSNAGLCLTWLTLIMAIILGLPRNVSATDLVTPDAWLAAQTAPNFRPGHTLPPLTRFGWSLPIELRILLAEKWGFALEFGNYADRKSVERALTDEKSPEYRVLRLAARHPDKYKLSLILSREMPKDADAWIMVNEATENSPVKIWSPTASDQALSLLANEQAGPIGRLAALAKPAIILNAGEYGIGVLGHSLKYWEKDAKTQRARGNEPWFDFISRMKAREQKRIRDAVMAVVPTIYVYYTNGGGTHRDREATWRQWSYDYKYMRDIGTFPSDEYYYKHFNEGWERSGALAFWSKGDLLTQALNAKGREIAAGDPFSYDWVNGGWFEETVSDENKQADASGAAVVDLSAGSLSELDLYAGFLKCIYMAGTLGANGGYYAYPRGGFAARFPEDRAPHWLLQLVELSRVHALYSYLEPFVKNSVLLPGSHRHEWGSFPAYELPTGQRNLRVLARKHRDYDAWLLTAWSATGSVQKGRVDIPARGSVEITGDGRGKIYLAVRNTLEEIDEGSVEKIAQAHAALFSAAQ